MNDKETQTGRRKNTNQVGCCVNKQKTKRKEANKKGVSAQHAHASKTRKLMRHELKYKQEEERRKEEKKGAAEDSFLKWKVRKLVRTQPTTSQIDGGVIFPV